MREQRDVIVADVIVGNTAIAAIADVALRQQVVLVQVPLGAVGRRAFRVAPVVRQPEPVVGVDDGTDRRFQFLRGDLALVDEGNLARAQVSDIFSTCTINLSRFNHLNHPRKRNSAVFYPWLRCVVEGDRR